MTILPAYSDPLALKGAQITYRQENKTPDQVVFSPVHLSSPLGGREGGESNYRKPKHIPTSRRLVLGNDRIFKNSKNRITNSDRINRFAIRCAFDYINRSVHYENKKMPSADDVTSHLFSLLCDRLNPSSSYEAERGVKGIMTFDMVERYAERAAAFAVDAWRPDYFEIQARKGAKGGRKSKRKPEYTYQDFLKVDGLTHAEAAAVLEVSVITVRRMRDRFTKPAPVPGDFLPEMRNHAEEEQPSVDDLLKGL